METRLKQPTLEFVKVLATKADQSFVRIGSCQLPFYISIKGGRLGPRAIKTVIKSNT